MQPPCNAHCPAYLPSATRQTGKSRFLRKYLSDLFQSFLICGTVYPPSTTFQNGFFVPQPSDGAFLSHRGTQKHHPYLDFGIFPTKTIHCWSFRPVDGNPPIHGLATMEVHIAIVRDPNSTCPHVEGGTFWVNVSTKISVSSGLT